MGKLIPILGIIVIAGFFWYISDQNNNLEQTLAEDFSKAKRLVHEFGNSGEEIVFFIDPQAPITEFTYVDKETEKEVYNYETGEIETITTTEQVKVLTSEITVGSYDRQTGDKKVCKRGNQCDITGEIILIDPVTGFEIPPPYGFYIQINCETSTDPVLNCSNFTQRTFNDLTKADKSFTYTFTTNLNDPTGSYVALVSVSSKFTSIDPVTGAEIKERRDGTLRVEVVA